jgi:hypothetical protein
MYEPLPEIPDVIRHRASLADEALRENEQLLIALAGMVALFERADLRNIPLDDRAAYIRAKELLRR